MFSVLRFLFLWIPGSQGSMNDSCESPSSSSSSSCPPLLTPTSNGPDGIGMFDMDSSDMAMSNGSEDQPNFDPRRHSFSEEELKPQPMIKKARKILVPDNMKVRLMGSLLHWCSLCSGTEVVWKQWYSNLIKSRLNRFNKMSENSENVPEIKPCLSRLLEIYFIWWLMGQLSSYEHREQNAQLRVILAKAERAKLFAPKYLYFIRNKRAWVRIHILHC